MLRTIILHFHIYLQNVQCVHISKKHLLSEEKCAAFNRAYREIVQCLWEGIIIKYLILTLLEYCYNSNYKVSGGA